MVIDRVKPGNWSFEGRLKRSEITQLDKNIGYCADSRSGHTSTIDATNTFTTNSQILFDDRSSITINNPEDININDGDLQNGGEIIGQYTTGYAEIELPSEGGLYTMPEYLYTNNMHYKLTGELTDDTTIVMPDTEGYYKFFDCDYSIYGGIDLEDGYGLDGYKVQVTVGYGTGVVLNRGMKAVIYCDGYDLYLVASSGKNMALVDQVFVKANPSPTNTPISNKILPAQQYASYGGGFGVPGYLVGDNYNNVQLGKYGLDQLNFNDLRTRDIVFLDGRAGDKFEIDFACGVQRTGGSASTVTFIAPMVSYGQGWFSSYYDNFLQPKDPTHEVIMQGAVTALTSAYVHGSSKSIFTAPQDGTYQFRLYMYYLLPSSVEYIFPVTGFGPAQFSIKQWRY